LLLGLLLKTVTTGTLQPFDAVAIKIWDIHEAFWSPTLQLGDKTSTGRFKLHGWNRQTSSSDIERLLINREIGRLDI
jgi:hypothetical protein